MTESTVFLGSLWVQYVQVAPRRAVDLDNLFSLWGTTYFRLGMLVLERKLHDEYKYAIIILIQWNTNISTFGTERVKHKEKFELFCKGLNSTMIQQDLHH